MVAYRFCRPDDVPFLVEAVNRCFDVHYPERPAMSLEAFQREIRELDLWPSNCMVAGDASEPLAVCIACKREKEVLVFRVGARPDALRQGHGRHILTSLSNKLAVLGPSRIVVEVPAESVGARRFFESLGYEKEMAFSSYRLDSRPSPPSRTEALVSITVDELLEEGLLENHPDLSWERQNRTLLNRKDRVRGMALVSPDRIEAWLLFCDRPQGELREVLRIGTADGEHAGTLVSLLLGFCRQGTDRAVVLRDVAPEEHSVRLIESLGFHPLGRRIRYTKEAEPG